MEIRKPNQSQSKPSHFKTKKGTMLHEIYLMEMHIFWQSADWQLNIWVNPVCCLFFVQNGGYLYFKWNTLCTFFFSSSRWWELSETEIERKNIRKVYEHQHMPYGIYKCTRNNIKCVSNINIYGIISLFLSSSFFHRFSLCLCFFLPLVLHITSHKCMHYVCLCRNLKKNKIKAAAKTKKKSWKED